MEVNQHWMINDRKQDAAEIVVDVFGNAFVYTGTGLERVDESLNVAVDALNDAGYIYWEGGEE